MARRVQILPQKSATKKTHSSGLEWPKKNSQFWCILHINFWRWQLSVLRCFHHFNRGTSPVLREINHSVLNSRQKEYITRTGLLKVGAKNDIMYSQGKENNQLRNQKGGEALSFTLRILITISFTKIVWSLWPFWPCPWNYISWSTPHLVHRKQPATWPCCFRTHTQSRKVRNPSENGNGKSLQVCFLLEKLLRKWIGIKILQNFDELRGHMAWHWVPSKTSVKKPSICIKRHRHWVYRT